MASASRPGWPWGFGARWHVDETYLKVRGRWTDLYRAIDRDGNLIDAMFSEHRDMRAATAFFRSARATMGFRPSRVTDGPLHTVETAFERIQYDERRKDVTVMQSSPITVRDFPGWSMAFTDTDPAASPLTGNGSNQAFSGRSSAGDHVVSLLKKVAAHKNDWLMSA